MTGLVILGIGIVCAVAAPYKPAPLYGPAPTWAEVAIQRVPPDVPPRLHAARVRAACPAPRRAPVRVFAEWR